MGHLLTIVLPLVYLSGASIGAGWLALRYVPLRPSEPPLLEMSIAFLLGQGILGTVMHAPALMGLFSLPVVLAITVPLFVFFAWVFLGRWPIFKTALKTGRQSFKQAPKLWKAVTLATGILLLLGASTLATLVTADAQAFYLALPKVVAASHRLVPLPGYEAFTSVGLIPELQLSALFLLGMPGASPRLYCWLTAMAGALVLVTIAKNAGLGKRGQILCLAMLATSSAVIVLWGQGKTDFFAASYGLAAVYFAQKTIALDGNRRSAIAFSGLFAGFAMVAKLTNIVALLPVLFVLLVWSDSLQLIRRQTTFSYNGLLKRYSAELLVFTTAALFSLLPHFIKNQYLLNILVDTYGSHSYFSADTTRQIVLTYPLVMLFGSYWAQYGNLSVLVLAFLPLVFLVKKAAGGNRPVLALFVAAMAGLLAWVAIFPAIPMPRYFLATLLLMTIPAAWAAEKLAVSRPLFNTAIGVTTLTCILLFYKGQPGIYFPVKDALVYAFNLERKPGSNVYTSGPRPYAALNSAAPQGARTYLLTYFRFWLRPDLIQTVNKTSEMFVWSNENPGRFWEQIYQNGFDYLLIDTTVPANKVALGDLPPWVKLDLISADETVTTYVLRFKNPPVARGLTTREVSPGAWDVVPAN